jgi:hypothetical protein
MLGKAVLHCEVHISASTVLQVGPGVKGLSEGDVVVPTVPLLGTFAQAAVVKAKQVVRVGRLASLDNNNAAGAPSSAQGERSRGPHWPKLACTSRSELALVCCPLHSASKEPAKTCKNYVHSSLLHLSWNQQQPCHLLSSKSASDTVCLLM